MHVTMSVPGNNSPANYLNPEEEKSWGVFAPRFNPSADKNYAFVSMQPWKFGFVFSRSGTGKATCVPNCPDGVPFLVKFPDRKSTRLNSSHPSISYAVFC